MNRSQRRRVNKQNQGYKTEQHQRNSVESEFDQANGVVDRLKITWKHLYKPGKMITIFASPLILPVAFAYALCRGVFKLVHPVYIMAKVWVKSISNYRL